MWTIFFTSFQLKSKYVVVMLDDVEAEDELGDDQEEE